MLSAIICKAWFHTWKIKKKNGSDWIWNEVWLVAKDMAYPDILESSKKRRERKTDDVETTVVYLPEILFKRDKYLTIF